MSMRSLVSKEQVLTGSDTSPGRRNFYASAKFLEFSSIVFAQNFDRIPTGQ